MIKKIFLSFLLLTLSLVGCSTWLRGYRIGFDSTWFPADVDGEASNINAYTIALLAEISAEENITFNVLDVSWSHLTQGLKDKQYEGALTGMPLTVENQEKFDFSHPYLLLGPVLIVPGKSQATSLADLGGKIVGVTDNDSTLIVQKFPHVIIENFTNPAILLEAVAAGTIDGALLPRLPARGLIEAQHRDTLKIVTSPLNQEGLRLYTLKGKNRRLLLRFNKGLQKLQKSGRLNALLNKFNVK